MKLYLQHIEGIQNSGIPGYHWVFTPSYLQFIITLGGMLIWGSTICIPPTSLKRASLQANLPHTSPR